MDGWMECFDEEPHRRKTAILGYAKNIFALRSIQNDQSKVAAKSKCLKPHGVQLFTEMTLETLKQIEEIQQLFDLMTISIVSASFGKPD